ncbi:unnamed protein product [Heterobilharzia americana]|nr:unnamed protein product [Heterobilharzia americana]
MCDSSFRLGDTPPVPPKKRARLDASTLNSTNGSADCTSFYPENMHLVSVLRNDPKSKCLVLHTRFGDDIKEAIVTLQKSSFPSDAETLKRCKVVNKVLIPHAAHETKDRCNELDEKTKMTNPSLFQNGKQSQL